VGRHRCAALAAKGVAVVAAVRGPAPKAALPGAALFVSGAIDGSTDWGGAIKKGDVVAHLAARVHVMRETAADPLEEVRKVNVAGTMNLARQAAAAGAKRFVFVSTIGVNGNDSGRDMYTEQDKPRPHNAYSVSKAEAEAELARLSAETGLEVVIVRPPLVYGPGNPGNMLTLLKLIARGIPLPLASVKNVKTFVYAGNLADALALCCSAPGAAGNTYLVGDGAFISTPDLVRRLAKAFGRSARLFPFPPRLLRGLLRLAGRGAAADSLILSLAADSSKIRRELGWKPLFTLEEGLQKTADWYRGKV
jgi:nucleoside-diphosphate-sugar epimerase